MDEMQIVRATIREERRRREWSQEKLGNMTHISKTSINGIEKGRESLSVTRANLILKEFGLKCRIIIEKIEIDEENL